MRDALEAVVSTIQINVKGLKSVHASVCCERLYVGMVPAESCRTCPATPSSVEISLAEDYEQSLEHAVSVLDA